MRRTKGRKNNQKDVLIWELIRIHCVAFWSVVVTITTFIGAWLAKHIDAVDAGLRAFWAVLMGDK